MIKRLILALAIGAAIAACSNAGSSGAPTLSSPDTTLPSSAPSIMASPSVMASPSAS